MLDEQKWKVKNEDKERVGNKQHKKEIDVNDMDEKMNKSLEKRNRKTTPESQCDLAHWQTLL